METSFVPRKTKDFDIPPPPTSSWTAIIFPKVMMPINAFWGRRVREFVMESFNAPSSSSSMQVSMTNRNTGGGTTARVIVYSRVLWGDLNV